MVIQIRIKGENKTTKTLLFIKYKEGCQKMYSKDNSNQIQKIKYNPFKANCQMKIHI